MKSAVFYGKHDLRVEEYAQPEVGPEDVLIQVKACGICGTDVHIYEGDKGAAEVTPPTILGHEFSGVVVKTGDKVTEYRAGDRVCIDPNCYCGACDACRNGEAHFCEHMIGYGTTVNGGFAEYCAVNYRQVYRLGENTTFEQGAMAEPVACCLHGLAKVALLEPVEGKREVGKKLGADICIDPVNEDVKAALAGSGMNWVQTVIECVGRPSTIEQAIEIAGKKAVVMMFGLTKPEETIGVKPFQIFQKELVLKASFINPYTQKRALDLIDSGRLDVSSMIYDVCGLDRLGDILSQPQLRAKGKYIISPEK